MISITTPRLCLRTWQESDIESYLQINQDKKVIEFLANSMSHEQIQDFFKYQNQQLQDRGFMLWAAELLETGELLGFIGLNYFNLPAHFSPAVEIGWRLGSQYWGFGYATEGAKAVLDFGFNKCALDEIVAFTVPENVRSRRVMNRISMTHDSGGNFAHPKLSADHPLSIHVLYRINKSSFIQSGSFDNTI